MIDKPGALSPPIFIYFSIQKFLSPQVIYKDSFIPYQRNHNTCGPSKTAKYEVIIGFSREFTLDPSGMKAVT